MSIIATGKKLENSLNEFTQSKFNQAKEPSRVQNEKHTKDMERNSYENEIPTREQYEKNMERENYEKARARDMEKNNYKKTHQLSDGRGLLIFSENHQNNSLYFNKFKFKILALYSVTSI